VSTVGAWLTQNLSFPAFHGVAAVILTQNLSCAAHVLRSANSKYEFPALPSVTVAILTQNMSFLAHDPGAWTTQKMSYAR